MNINNKDLSLKKLAVRIIFGLSLALFVLSIMVIIGSFLYGLWAPVFVFSFTLLFGFTGILYSHQAYLFVVKENQSKPRVAIANGMALVTFLYMTGLTTYLYFFEDEPGMLKLIVIAVIATIGAIINLFVAKSRTPQIEQ
ncbi:hypothetical protein BAU15_14520 [Enterococcus sp. JM4C]|uniref:hypothetical protein n=1 Tax=Candidatus Enterococcus huntleyi TaxID=1857217 RepID=UPI00137A5B65|nr:hypothetical protein [Enterococcus sp. JM4C]KAF1296913.1 hypothetical protein BAU15_14520 [Enterococcus sp. JM4C]